MGKEEQTPRTICIPCEDTDFSQKIVDWAKGNLVEPQDKIVLISVRQGEIKMGKPWPKDIIDFMNTFHQKGAERLEATLMQLKDRFEGNQVEVKVLRGNAQSGLVKYIDDEVKPNVCVVGESKARVGFEVEANDLGIYF
jgi:hypothetical protein